MQKLESADGTTVAYQRTGSGPALVLVAGACLRRPDVVAPALVEWFLS